MRILIYSDFHIPEAVTTSIANAMERAGHIVCRWGRNESIGFPILEIEKCASMYKVECFIFTGGREIGPDYIKRLQGRFPRAVFCQWNFDLMFKPDVRCWFEPLAKLMDVCFELDDAEHDMWEQPEINRCQAKMGIDPSVYRPIGRDMVTDADREKYSADVAFIGSPYELGGRSEVLNAVSEWCLANGRTFRIWGHWTEYVLGEELAKVVGLSKIIIGHESGSAGGWSDRVYRVLAYGGFLLAHHRPGMETEFGDGTHLRFWRTTEQLLLQVGQSLESEQFRHVIAQAGCSLVRAEYTWDKRIHRPMQLIAQLAAAKANR